MLTARPATRRASSGFRSRRVTNSRSGISRFRWRNPLFETQSHVERLVDAFHETHERIFAVRETESVVEFINWKARRIVRLDHPKTQRRKSGRSPTASLMRSGRPISAATPGRKRRSTRRSNSRPHSGVAGPSISRAADDDDCGLSGDARRHLAIRTFPSSSRDAACAARGRGCLERSRMSARRKLDPVLTAVMANRLDGIVREMSNTLPSRGTLGP